jgi:hypothetical protein
MLANTKKCSRAATVLPRCFILNIPSKEFTGFGIEYSSL